MSSAEFAQWAVKAKEPSKLVAEYILKLIMLFFRGNTMTFYAKQTIHVKF